MSIYDVVEEIETRTSRKQQKPRGRVKGTLFFLLMLVVGALAWSSFNLYLLQQGLYKEITTESQSRDSMAAFRNGDAINILLIGVDSWQEGGKGVATEEGGRSDTLILATIDPKSKTTTLLSIPRDTYTSLSGVDGYDMDKINAGYSYNGTAGAVDAVSYLLDVPIDYYLEIHMEGLKSLVDAIGGIDVVSPLTFTVYGKTYPEGEVTHLNGEEALNFARMRKLDPEGDIGRGKRQQIVIDAILKKIISPSGFIKQGQLVTSLINYTNSNLKLTDYIAILFSAGTSLTSIEKQAFSNYSIFDLDGISYVGMDPDELGQKSTEIQEKAGVPGWVSKITY